MIRYDMELSGAVKSLYIKIWKVGMESVRKSTPAKYAIRDKVRSAFRAAVVSEHKGPILFCPCTFLILESGAYRSAPSTGGRKERRGACPDTKPVYDTLEPGDPSPQVCYTFLFAWCYH